VFDCVWLKSRSWTDWGFVGFSKFWLGFVGIGGFFAKNEKSWLSFAFSNQRSI
jgi:hypothetical protein